MGVLKWMGLLFPVLAKSEEKAIFAQKQMDKWKKSLGAICDQPRRVRMNNCIAIRLALCTGDRDK
jgi:hypothetical protein